MALYNQLLPCSSAQHSPASADDIIAAARAAATHTRWEQGNTGQEEPQAAASSYRAFPWVMECDASEFK